MNMKNRRERFSILFKPTHKCNFKCEYCHDRINRERVGDVEASDKVLKQTLRLLEDYAKEVSFIWHGGEPTTMGTEYYNRVQEEFYYRFKTKFDQSMQSNGSLLDEEWLDLSEETGISIGISNDIMTQNIRVGKEYSLEELVEMYGKRNMRLGIITVINGENVQLMTEMLQKANDMKIKNLSMNRVYNPSINSNIPEHLELNPEIYGKEFSRMLDTWLHSEMEIAERSIMQKISLITGVTDGVTCTYGDCRDKWIGVGPTGEVTFCDRDFGSDFDFGNIMDMESINDYHNTEGFKKFYSDIQYRLDNVCSGCSVYKMCRGGCNANHLSATGTLRKNDAVRCECIINALKETYDKLRTVNLMGDEISESANKYLRNIDLIPLTEIVEFLKDKGYNLDKIEYDKEKFTECSEFKIFKLFNPNRSTINNEHSDCIVYICGEHGRLKEDKYNGRKQALETIYSSVAEEVKNILL